MDAINCNSERIRWKKEYLNASRDARNFAGQVASLEARVKRLAHELGESRAEILNCWRIWVADDRDAVPPPQSATGKFLARIDAALKDIPDA